MAELVAGRGEFGFGCMRLPRQENGQIDLMQVTQMVDLFLENGYRYFDTAYGYDGAEEALQATLVKRYPRERFMLTTKLTLDRGITREEARRRIQVSMERLGVEYLDYYLLHNVAGPNVALCDDLQLWDYVRQLKQEGLIHHYGFSSHADPETLDRLLTEHPDVDVVQLQINYLDWKDPGVQAEKCCQVACNHGKPIIVMEPCKGGALANYLPQAAADILHEANPVWPDAAWALRYAATRPGVAMVLSGMSTIEQVAENVKTMRKVCPLTQAEEQAVSNAVEAIRAIDQVQCTGCGYCTRVCPQSIPIPGLIRVLNRYLIFPDQANCEFLYRMHKGRGAGAGDCAGCGQCEDACPQRLHIRNLLQKIAKTFE